jgi:hypothetical protein
VAKIQLVLKEGILTEGTDIYVNCVIDLKMFLLTDHSKPRNCKTKVTIWVHYIVLE